MVVAIEYFRLLEQWKGCNSSKQKNQQNEFIDHKQDSQSTK